MVDAGTLVRRSWLPSGNDGVYYTLGAMAGLIRTEARSPALRSVALSLAPDAGSVEWCVTLRGALGAWWTFRDDPPDWETLYTPLQMLRMLAQTGTVAADCDDAAVLAGALAGAVGCAVRLTVVSLLDSRAPYSHVWTSVQPFRGVGAGVWIECDVTRPMQDVPLTAICKAFIYPVLP